MHGGLTPGGTSCVHFKHGRFSRYVPKGLRKEWARAAADPELCGLRFELEALSVRMAQLLKRLESPGPNWSLLAESLGHVQAAVAAKELDTLQTALGELALLLDEGRQTDLTDRTVWSELRQVIQERARVAAAENRRLVEAGLMLTKERALSLVVTVQEAVRAAVTDPDTFARGPQAVMNHLHRGLCLVLGGPAENEDRVMEGQVADGAGGDPGSPDSRSR
jgi:hypothetical protein